MARYAHVIFVLWLAGIAGLIALVAYKILTDATVPLFSLGW